MELKATLIAVSLTAIVSSALTAGVIKMGELPQTPNVNVSALSAQLNEIRNELALEIQARKVLQETVNNRSNSNTATAQTQVIATQAIVEPEQEQLNSPDQRRAEIERFRDQRRAERLARQQPGYRAEQLVSAGFAEEDAARIVQIESEESLRQLQRQYELQRARAEQNNTISNIDTNPIRSELGDDAYARYLEANGRPSAAQVNSVISGSPGGNAGLQAGDQITSYAGQRVFNLNEVNRLTVQGSVGESVLIEVQRAGQSVQLTIPRGPIGVSNSFRR